MNRLDLQKDTELLIAESIIKGFENKRYVDWAIKLLCNNYESESLYILAGLDDEDSIMVEKYFALVTKELGIEVEVHEKLLLDRYIIHIIENTITNRKNIANTVEVLQNMVDKTSYKDNSHFDFLYLYDELEELTQTPRREFAIAKFKAFLNEIEQ